MSMQALLSASQSMSQMQTMQSARTKMQGNAAVLRTESKQNGGDEKKEAQAEALEEKSAKLLNDLMNEAADVNETLMPDEDVTTETETKEETEETKVPPKTDTVEISTGTAVNIGKSVPEKAESLDAVTYNADGSTIAGVQEPNTSVFSATA